MVFSTTPLMHSTASQSLLSKQFAALSNSIRQKALLAPAQFDARTAMDAMAQCWSEAVPERALTIEETDRAFTLARFQHLEHEARGELSDPLDHLASIIIRILNCISIVFCARLFAIPLQGAGVAIEWFWLGVILFFVTCGFLIWNDHRNRQVQDAQRRSLYQTQHFRHQRLLLESALAHLRAELCI